VQLLITVGSVRRQLQSNSLMFVAHASLPGMVRLLYYV
jgi:hypothetical protein